jgi:hypothetical protein
MAALVIAIVLGFGGPINLVLPGIDRLPDGEVLALWRIVGHDQ